MEEGSSAQSYIEQFEDIVAEATILDMDIIKTPEQLALQFLVGLPKSLENFSDIISLNSQESGKELTPKSVTTALLSHVRTKSSKLDNVPEEDTAMNVDKSKAACHHCGKKGHFKSECYDLVGKPKGQGGMKGQGSQRGGGSKKKEEANKAGRSGRDWGLATVATGNVEEEAFSVDDGAWIADSRCSNHICNDRSALHDFKPHSTTVKVADNKVVGTEGIGNLIVTTTVNGVTRTFQISDVYYIPNFANLISIGQLTHRGVNVNFTATGCTFRKDGTTLIEGVIFRKNLYKLKIDDIQASQSTEGAGLSAEGVDAVETLHRRLGHASVTAMRRLVTDGILPPLKERDLVAFEKRTCVPCIQGKQHRSPFHTSTHRSTTPLERVHSDLQGPMPTESFSRKWYMMTIWDDATNYHWTFALEKKSDTYRTFVEWKARVEKEKGRTVRILRSDNGGEYLSDAFKAYLKTEGIKHETSIPYTPQQNGKAERGNRTIEEKITCLLHDTDNLQDRGRYWAESMATATFLINRLPSVATGGRTPYEAYRGSKPSVHFLRAFGSIAYVHDPHHKKHQSKTLKAILVGYGEPNGKKAYRLRKEEEGKIIFSRDVKFDEGSSKSKKAELDLVPSADGGVPDQDKKGSDVGENDVPEANIPIGNDDPARIAKARQPSRIKPSWSYEPAINDQPDVDVSGRYGRGKRNQKSTEPAEFASFVSLATPNAKQDLSTLPNPITPKTTKEARTSPHAEYWKSAMDEEMESFDSNGVWELTELPSSRRTVGGRWVYLLKKDPNGKIAKFKARWVAKGYSQRDGIDYTETYAPVSRMNSLRIFFTIAAQRESRTPTRRFQDSVLHGQSSRDRVHGSANRVREDRKGKTEASRSPP